MSSNESLIQNNECHVSSVDRYICRLCLQCTEISMEEIAFLAEKIEFVTKLTIHVEDGLPAHICTQCKFKLAIADGFIKRSITSDIFLRSRHSEEWAEPNQTVAEPIIQVKSEPQETDAEEKPDMDLLQLYYIEQSQLEADCSASPVKQFSSDPLQINSLAENSLNATCDSQPIVNNIETFAEQSSTAESLACTGEFLSVIKTENLSETDPIVSSDNDNYEGFANYYQYVGSPKMQAQTNQDFLEGPKRADSTVSDQTLASVKVNVRTKLTCNHCGSSFHKRKQLLSHLKLHFEQELYKCTKCQKEFLEKASLTSHLKCHIQAKNFKCRKCKKQFGDKVGLMAHEILKIHGTSFDCEYCPESFETRYRLKIHCDSFHPLKKCDCCDCKFYDISKLTIHKQVMHSTEYNDLNCSKCNSTFASGTELETHLYVSSCRSFFACNKCSLSFETEVFLQDHLLTYTDDVLIYCEICEIMNTSLDNKPMIFENRQNLKQHVKEIHATENFRCRKCKWLFNSKNSLDQHFPNCLVTETSLTCPTCQRTYSCKNSLARHLAAHADIKPHKCRRCFEGFVDVATAEIHMAQEQCTPVFKCPLCPKYFARKSLLTNHTTKNHKDDRTYNCPRCHQSFSDRPTMEDHFYLNVCEGPMKCTICPKSFANEDYLAGHIERMHAEKQGQDFQCTICKKSLKTKLSLEQHKYRVHIIAKNHVCQICRKKFASATILDEHTKLQACKSPFQCEVCLKVFFCRPSFKRHSLVHNSNDSIHCGQCDKTFKYNSTLIRHQRNYHGGPRSDSGSHLCDVCRESFSTLADLESHAYSHSFVTNHFTCGYCEEEFTEKASLGYHMKAHHSKRKEKLKCMHCAKIFKSHQGLFSHTKIVHNDFRPFACDTCGRSFATKEEIARHVTCHTKIRLMCDICSKSTTSKFQMRIHVRKHTGDRPFHCKVCSETFVSNFMLKSHVSKKHSKNEHFECYACKESFSRKAELVIHLYRHTEKHPFTCEICTAGFRQKLRLDRHQKRQHPELFPSSDPVVVQSFDCSNRSRVSKNINSPNRHSKRSHGYSSLRICKICGFAFRSNKELTGHEIAGHTIKLQHTCKVCSKTFISLRQKNKHFRRFHTVDCEMVGTI